VSLFVLSPEQIPEIEDREEVILLGAYLPKNLLLPIESDHLRQDPRLGSEVAVVVILKLKIFNENSDFWEDISAGIFRYEYPRYPTIEVT
jgi:hypothetical protein